MEPGIYENLPAAEYHAAPGASHSRLEILKDHSPAELKFQMDNPEPEGAIIGCGDAMEFGSAFHDAVLLPEKYGLEYRTLPFRDMRAKGAEDWCKENAGKKILRPDAAERITAMRGAILDHKAAANLISAATHKELSLFWIDSPTGVLCKMRADIVIVEKTNAVVMDLKTTTNPGPEAFAGAIEAFGYFRQAAMYLDGLNYHGIPADSFGFIPISKEPPHTVAVYALDSEAIEIGMRENRKLLNLYAICGKSGFWPAYPKIEKISLPEWKLRKARMEMFI